VAGSCERNENKNKRKKEGQNSKTLIQPNFFQLIWLKPRDATSV
jgi:hypothetical protein